MYIYLETYELSKPDACIRIITPETTSKHIRKHSASIIAGTHSSVLFTLDRRIVIAPILLFHRVYCLP